MDTQTGVSDVRLLTAGEALLVLVLSGLFWWNGAGQQFIVGWGLGLGLGLCFALINRMQALAEIESGKRYKHWRENLWQTDRAAASALYEMDQERREKERGARSDG